MRDMRDTRGYEHSAKKYVGLTHEGREGGHIKHLCKVSTMALGDGAFALKERKQVQRS